MVFSYGTSLYLGWTMWRFARVFRIGPAVVRTGQLLGGLHIHGEGRAAPAPDDSALLHSCWEIAAAADAVMEMRYLTPVHTTTPQREVHPRPGRV
jgi:hypothetical protein